jgi:hypothetical protein
MSVLGVLPIVTTATKSRRQSSPATKNCAELPLAFLFVVAIIDPMCVSLIHSTCLPCLIQCLSVLSMYESFKCDKELRTPHTIRSLVRTLK